ncbi:O-antigen ligase family protein [Brachybacterium vulturis]|uniref:O-antigen ligase family protein n=1 Tax=Brachybacterium vulturis TaxID=2017484 RepID=UPI0037355157
MPILRLSVTFLVLSILLSSRFSIPLFGGELDVFGVAFIGLSVASWLMSPHRSSRSRAPLLFALTAGPLLLLLGLLPTLGILVADAGITLLYAWILPAKVLATLLLSRAVQSHGLDIRRIGLIPIVAHGVYGLLQTLYRAELIPTSVWGPMANWDIRSQQYWDAEYVIVGRSTGLFINANEFGMWSCLAVVFSATLAEGRVRVIGLFLGVAGVLGSQSRTAWIVLALIIVFYAVRGARHRRAAEITVGVVSLLAPVVALGWLTGAFAAVADQIDVERIAGVLAVAEEGVDADANLNARVDAWRDVWIYSGAYPFGTLLPPIGVFGGYIDNQYVSFFLQGGPFLLGAFLLLLASPVMFRCLGFRGGMTLRLVVLVVAVSGLTMTPVSSFSASSLGWLAATHVVGSTPRTAAGLREHGVLA